MLTRSPGSITIIVPAARLRGFRKLITRSRWHKRQLNKEAVQRYRERREGRNKRAVALVEYDGVMVDALVRWDYLPHREAYSSKDIGQAIARAISEAARSGK
ncbi:hypothetical protein XI06_14120 [Bradyrhizobium sp. CCBAU 11434]|uniref:hypothetical protein n=1 Tax=Bradyrhizobium sp. CCBAU 11434 TaxID=1630885 RepID=UPI002306D192|nr:hypothetical protein [Bradyrhizobium sp. CCBAU 11434]MDA9521459.1 hypothetical protein [Bradyrhizobium sp. CCBAU 11434]